jgi:CHAT domain-containing protein
MKASVKLLLIVSALVISGFTVKHFAPTEAVRLPSEIQKALAHEPELAKKFAEGLKRWEQQQWSMAIPIWEALWNDMRSKFGEHHIATATAAIYLGYSYQGQGLYDKALPLQQHALAIFEKVLGADHPDTARSLNSLASIYGDLAQHDKALPLLQRALAIVEKPVGSEHLATAVILNDLALTYSAIAQQDKALPLLQRALAIFEKVKGADHPHTALGLSNLAQIYGTLAEHDKALPLQHRALAISEKVLGEDHPTTALGLGNLALTHHALAQHDKALPLQQRALAIREKVQGAYHPDTVLSMNNVAGTYGALAQPDKALPLHQRALALSEKVFGADHPTTALVLNNLAGTYSALAQRDKALPLQQRALAIRENVLGINHPDTALSLNNLATTLMHGDATQKEQALHLALRALAINELALGSDHPTTANNQYNIAWELRRQGQPEAAIVFQKSAVNTLQLQRERASRIGTDALQSYTGSVSFVYQSLAQNLTDLGRLAEAQMVLDMLKEDEQFEFVRRSANADPRRSRMSYTATEQVWADRYRQMAGRLAALGAEDLALQKQAKLGLSPAQRQRQTALAEDLKVARAGFDAYLTELRASFAQKGSARTVEVVEISEKALRETQGLLKALGDDVVLLQYYITDDKVNMLLTTPGVQLARSSVVSVKDLSRQIADFRRLLRDPKSDALPAAKAMYQTLLAPVAEDLAQAGAKTVMLSLDGALRYVPFAALHDGQQYAAQRWNLPMYTSVTREKLRDAVSPAWQAAGLGVTRAVGEFEALPAVKAEMSSIVKSGSGGVLPGEVFLDQAFSAARLKEVSQRPFQLMHVASHFRFSPGTEVNSFLLLGDGEQLTLGDIRTQNYRFDNVDLLTLSACDTGLGGGRDAQGREIEGFGVIAQQQGAKAVLATLWPVADQSTATLMAELYKQRQSQRLSKIAALRQAQLTLLAQPRYAHPFYWAPFILMGNWK